MRRLRALRRVDTKPTKTKVLTWSFGVALKQPTKSEYDCSLVFLYDFDAKTERERKCGTDDENGEYGKNFRTVPGAV